MKKWGWILFLAPLAAYSQVENVQVEVQKQTVVEIAPAVVEAAKENASVADMAPSAEVKKTDEKEVAWNFEAISNEADKANELVSYAHSYEPFIEVDSEQMDDEGYIAEEMNDEMDSDYEVSYEVSFEDEENDNGFDEQDARVVARPKIVQRNVQESKKQASQAKVAPKNKRSVQTQQPSNAKQGTQPQVKQKKQAQVESKKAPAPQAKVAPKNKRSVQTQQPSNAKQGAQPQVKQKKQAQVESQKAPAPATKRQGMSYKRRAAAPEMKEPASKSGKQRATAQRPASRKQAAESQKQSRVPEQSVKGKKNRSAKAQPAEVQKNSKAQDTKKGKAQRKVADNYEEYETYVPSDEYTTEGRVGAHPGKRPAAE